MERRTTHRASALKAWMRPTATTPILPGHRAQHRCHSGNGYPDQQLCHGVRTSGRRSVHFTMKSGSNQLHGSGFDYFGNEDLNAGNPFYTGQPNPRPRNRPNDFGITAGRPIYFSGSIAKFIFEPFSARPDVARPP